MNQISDRNHQNGQETPAEAHKRRQKGRKEEMMTLSEMERCASILDPGTLAVVRNALGAVPLSPYAPRLAALEADNARLLAENVLLAAKNAELWEQVERLSMQVADEAGTIRNVVPVDIDPATLVYQFPDDAQPTVKGTFPARALARRHQVVGMVTLG
jgi:hypothetical protein